MEQRTNPDLTVWPSALNCRTQSRTICSDPDNPGSFGSARPVVDGRQGERAAVLRTVLAPPIRSKHACKRASLIAFDLLEAQGNDL